MNDSVRSTIKCNFLWENGIQRTEIGVRQMLMNQMLYFFLAEKFHLKKSDLVQWDSDITNDMNISENIDTYFQRTSLTCIANVMYWKWLSIDICIQNASVRSTYLSKMKSKQDVIQTTAIKNRRNIYEHCHHHRRRFTKLNAQSKAATKWAFI